MHAPSNRTRRILLRSSGPVAVLLAGLMVWQGSQAAFTAETFNAGNNWNTGSVLLTNDGTGSAMFTLQDLVPMQTGSHCINVTATSNVAGTIRTYFPNGVANGLENNLTMKVEQGTGASYADCTNFVSASTFAATPLATMFSAHDLFSNGILEWNKGTGVETQSYKFTWTFDTSALSQAQIDALQGTSVRTDIEWELQNN
jgi:hypothetical protein